MRMMVALLLLGACAPSLPPGLTAEDEAALNAAADLLEDDSYPLSEIWLETYPEARGMPADVQRFIVRWQDCRHWLGELAWDAERGRQIDRAIREACAGIDSLGRQLRMRHAGNDAVLARIAAFEPLGH